MEISSAMQTNLSSLQQAIGISMISKSMNQDAQSVSALMQGMQIATAKLMEQSVNPHLGGNIDIRV